MGGRDEQSVSSVDRQSHKTCRFSFKRLTNGDTTTGRRQSDQPPGSFPDSAGRRAHVVDHRRAEFARRIDELDFEGLRVAVSRTASANELIRDALPGFEIVQIGEPRDFFESSDEGIDALVWLAENGSAWTLLYPRFSVVPLRPAIQLPVAYAVARRDEEFADFLSRFIEYHTRNTVR